MKASEHGVLPPVSVGHWSFNETDREMWSHEWFATREEAIAAGRAYFGSPLGLSVGRFVEVEVDAPDAGDVIDRICCRMCDSVPGDFMDDFLAHGTPDSHGKLTAAIEATVAAWLTEHAEWPDFAVVADVEEIKPYEMVP